MARRSKEMLVWLRVLGTLLLIAAVLGAVYFWFGDQMLDSVATVAGIEEAEEPPSAVPVTMPEPVERRRESERLGVSALGRLEPEDGIVRVAGPSDMVVVVESLEVDEGDRVEEGDLIATLDSGNVIRAKIERIEAQLIHARREFDRSQELNREQVLAESERDRWENEVNVLEAEKRLAEAELERSSVHAPFDGQVLKIHTWPGERVGPNGILELAKTHRMYAIAEVYETDIGRVKKGQRALVTSPALAEPLTGRVEWISLKVAKQDALGTDPAARRDARVIEVEIRLDDSAAAAALTHLQVEVLIEPADGSN